MLVDGAPGAERVLAVFHSGFAGPESKISWDKMLLRAALFTLLAASGLLASGQKKSHADDAMRPNPAAATPDASTIATCPAGGPLGEVDLQVKLGDASEPLPFASIVHLTENDTVQYAPVTRGREKRGGEVALVLVPTKIAGKDQLLVTDIRDADKPQEWMIPRTVALVAFVYGPQGLSKKKVRSFLSQDSLLVAQMADYADKTSQTEALLAALSSSESSPASMNAALNGFASQYGVSAQIDKTAPPAAQAQALFAAINPQLSSYSPLAATGATRASQTASLATAAAGLFFGSPVGLLAGGTGMLLDLRSIAFPDTQFRSAFAQVIKGPRLNFCGERGPTPPRTRIAYVWASRIPNAPTPKIQIGDAHFIAAGQKSPVTAEVEDPNWKFLQHARKWTLQGDNHQSFAVPVLKLQNQKSVEIDLTKATVPPGAYHLAGYWDWAPFEATGTVNILPLSDFNNAKLKPESQDQLLAKTGKIPVTLTGSDFEFTIKVELKKSGDEFSAPEPVKFLLPKGARLGPQDQMDIQVDTRDLQPGSYEFLLSQGDDKAHSVQFAILPNPPQIADLPIIVNEGVATQHYVLKGERLDQIVRLEAAGASFDLAATSAGSTERNVTVRLQSGKPGATLPVQAYLQSRNEPLTFSNGLQVTGPLPVIASSRLSLPAGMSIKTSGDEFPAGSTLLAVLDVKNIDRTSQLQLSCAEGAGDQTRLSIGKRTQNSELQQLSPDQLFLSFDTASLSAPCTLQAAIDSGKSGVSSPITLAHMIRVPQVDSVVPGPAAAGADGITLDLKGTSLEMVEKAGWDSESGVGTTGLPVPLPGEGQKQILHLNLPAPPAPDAPLYLWLRGDKEGRVTSIHIPSAPSTGASTNPSPSNGKPGTKAMGPPAIPR